MADLKFACPECHQRIGVDDSAAGVSIDCPACRTSLVIPQKAEDVPVVIVRRKLVALAGSFDASYSELDRKQKDLEGALAEAAKLREDLKKARAQADAASSISRMLCRSAGRRASFAARVLAMSSLVAVPPPLPAQPAPYHLLDQLRVASCQTKPTHNSLLATGYLTIRSSLS